MILNACGGWRLEKWPCKTKNSSDLSKWVSGVMRILWLFWTRFGMRFKTLIMNENTAGHFLAWYFMNVQVVETLSAKIMITPTDLYMSDVCVCLLQLCFDFKRGWRSWCTGKYCRTLCKHSTSGGVWNTFYPCGKHNQVHAWALEGFARVFTPPPPRPKS